MYPDLLSNLLLFASIRENFKSQRDGVALRNDPVVAAKPLHVSSREIHGEGILGEWKALLGSKVVCEDFLSDIELRGSASQASLVSPRSIGSPLGFPICRPGADGSTAHCFCS